MIEQLTPEAPSKRTPFIDFNGLRVYAVLLGLAGGAFLYLQLNGISIIPDSNTGHEGKQHLYGNHK